MADLIPKSSRHSSTPNTANGPTDGPRAKKVYGGDTLLFPKTSADTIKTDKLNPILVDI